MSILDSCTIIFFFTDPSTTEIYTLSLHDALPIWSYSQVRRSRGVDALHIGVQRSWYKAHFTKEIVRSEEHTSELQSLRHLVCRLLLEKKKKNNIRNNKTKENIRST